MSLLALALLGAGAVAQPTVQLSAGWFQTAPKAFINPSPTLQPRVGIPLGERLSAEAGVGLLGSGTAIDGIVYRRLTPRAEMVIAPLSEAGVDLLLAVGGGVSVQRVWGEVAVEDGEFYRMDRRTAYGLATIGPSLRIPLTGALSVRSDLRYVATFGGTVDGNLELLAGLELRPRSW